MRGNNELWKKVNQETQVLVLVLSLTVYVTLGQSFTHPVVFNFFICEMKG